MAEALLSAALATIDCYIIRSGHEEADDSDGDNERAAVQFGFLAPRSGRLNHDVSFYMHDVNERPGKNWPFIDKAALPRSLYK